MTLDSLLSLLTGGLTNHKPLGLKAAHVWGSVPQNNTKSAQQGSTEDPKPYEDWMELAED